MALRYTVHSKQAPKKSHEIQDGGGRYFEIRFNGHNSVIIAHICTKFGTETKTKNDLRLRNRFTAVSCQPHSQYGSEFHGSLLFKVLCSSFCIRLTSVEWWRVMALSYISMRMTVESTSASAILKIGFNGNISVAVAYVCVKFRTVTKIDDP